MPSKKCPFCAETIQSDARKCKFCGEFLDAKPVVIEKTAKRYKKQTLIASMLAICSVVFGMIAAASHSSGFTGFFGLVFFGSIVWFVVIRFQVWWNHG